MYKIIQVVVVCFPVKTKMDKNVKIAIGVVTTLVIAGIGAFLLLGNSGAAGRFLFIFPIDCELMFE